MELSEKEDHVHIVFKGLKLIFIGNKQRTDGSLTTIEAFENFLPSYAHLFRDGKVRRFQKIIGTKEDI